MKSSLAVPCFPGVGASALTGGGLFTPILMLINAFAMLAGAGGAPRAAISMGKKDNRTAEKILGNCFSLLIIMAVILTFIFFIFAPQMLTLFGASGKTSLCRCLFPHLHPWKYFCTDRYGNEPVHYNTGICKDQYAHHRYWCSDQYYP